MTIKVLPPELASQIAAGEIVERPASVVKELLENSLDAGAAQITIEIKGGGVEQVRITDDGHGIPAGQVELAFQRHATSKLDSQAQLEAVSTLGFRGEALPSIAAVSQLTLTTRPHDADGGHRIAFRTGNKVRSGAYGCPPGTSIEVSDLFGNLPARRKFLRSDSSEASRIQDFVSRYALAYPAVRFRLTVDGRQALSTSGNGRAKETLLAVYGPQVAEGMLEVEGEDPDSGYQVYGFASAPSLHRANRTYMTFFVNRRLIQSRTLSFALEEAYHGLLPERRYPMGVFDLTVPYEEVDVNAHPSKREVRFRNESKVFSTLQRAVRAALVADSPVPQYQPAEATQPLAMPRGSGGPSFFPQTAFSGGSPGGYTAPPGSAEPRRDVPALKVVGQVRLTYIVAEGPDGMYLVDQHAAHERVVFDRICREASGKEAQAQALLAPASVELTPSQEEVYKNHAEFLSSYGFDVEHFGDRGYLVRSVPSVLTTQDPGQSFTDVLDMVAFEGLLRQHEDVLAASIACHSAIRAGKALTEPEMRALLEELEATDNPHTCPHGRPTMIHFSAINMEREFGRR